MKCFKRFAVFFICSALILAGCGRDSDVVQSDVPTDTPLPAPQMETITIYTVDASNMSTTPSQVKKKEDDDSLSYICQLVADNLEDDDIHITDAVMDEDTAIITFDSSGKPLKNCDEQMEYLVLDCFANSVLDNVDGCHNVVFRSDEGAYKSENLVFDEDEVYASQ